MRSAIPRAVTLSLFFWSFQVLAADQAPFVIGVFVQPADMMAVWKSRGVDTVVGVPEGHDFDVWTKAAAANGLRMIRAPRPDPSGDAAETHLMAWMLRDEPSNVAPDAPGVDIDHVAVKPEEIDAIARGWLEALPDGRQVPLFLNLTGAHVTDERINAPLMADYVDSDVVHLVSHDFYTVNSGVPMIHEMDGYVTTRQGRAIDRLAEWSGGKPQYSFIESGDIDRDGTLPDAGEMRAQIWSSVIHGAVGIVYFPVAFEPFSFDGTPENLVAEMFASHARLAELEALLVDAATGRPKGTLHRMAPEGGESGQGMMPYPFEARSYDTPKGVYWIILNLSPEGEAVLDDPGSGISGLGFRRYEVKAGYVASGGLRETSP